MRRKVKLIISEPWDFDIDGKGNGLFGEIRGICFGPDKKNWQGKYLLIKVDEPFTWKETIISDLIVSPRHVGYTIEDILHRREVSVGISYVLSGAKVEVGKMFKPEDVKYAFIGSIEPIKHKRSSIIKKFIKKSNKLDKK